jgi:hypothetical protein
MIYDLPSEILAIILNIVDIDIFDWIFDNNVYLSELIKYCDIKWYRIEHVIPNQIIGPRFGEKCILTIRRTGNLYWNDIKNEKMSLKIPLPRILKQS